MRILTSLHGKLAGLGRSLNGSVPPMIVPGGYISGEHGNQMELASPQTVAFFDDFLGDVLADQWHVIAGSDSPAAAAIVTNVGGTLVLTTGDSNASLAADGVMADLGILNWSCANGTLHAQARLKISAITAVQLFFGFTDQFSALEMPVTLSGTTFTTVATDACGFLFDTNATTDTIRLVGVANDVDATHQDTGLAYVADTYVILRVSINSSGVATFFINGVQVGTQMAAAITTSVALTPVFAARSLAANSKTLTADYLNVSMGR